MKIVEGGRIFEEGDRLSDFDDDDLTEEEWDRYNKQVEESEGFDIDPFPGSLRAFGLRFPYRLDYEKSREAFKFLINLGIAHYNENEKASIELEEILKVNAEICSPMIFNITFKAKDASTGQSRTYKSKVYWRIPIEESWVFFTRVKPGTKQEGHSGMKARKRDTEEEKEGKKAKLGATMDT